MIAAFRNQESQEKRKGKGKLSEGAMSLGYAEKLSYIEDVGNVGMDEFFDPPHVLQEKVRVLSSLSLYRAGFLFFLTIIATVVGCGI